MCAFPQGVPLEAIQPLPSMRCLKRAGRVGGFRAFFCKVRKEDLVYPGAFQVCVYFCVCKKNPFIKGKSHENTLCPAHPEAGP